MLRIHGACLEFLDFFPVHQGFHVRVVDDFDFLHFMGRTESVKEMHKGDAAFDGGQVGHQGQVLGFLYGRGREHGEAVCRQAMTSPWFAEDGQSLCGQGARRHMKNAGAGARRRFVHVGDHQQQSLGSREGAGQRTGRQGTVHGCGRSCFGLHFPNLQGLVENVFYPCNGPFISMFGHGR